MATRFYMANFGAAPVSPTFNAGWEQTGEATRSLMLAKGRASQLVALANTAAITVPITTTQDILCWQFVSEPFPNLIVLDAQPLGVNGVVRVFESATTANVTLACVVSVVSNDGTTVRGTLYSNFNVDLEFALTGVAATRRFNTASTASTAVTAQSGDRLVVEVGGHAAAPSAAGSFTMRFGNSAASDAPNTVATTDLNPWVELGHNIWDPYFNNFRSVAAGDGVSVAERPRCWGTSL